MAATPSAPVRQREPRSAYTPTSDDCLHATCSTVQHSGTQGGRCHWSLQRHRTDAAVLMVGRFEDLPLDAFRRVMETNFFGRVYGTRTALRHFRSRGSGVIIAVSSVLGRVVQPYASAYVASKFAVRGLIQSLRTDAVRQPEHSRMQCVTLTNRHSNRQRSRQLRRARDSRNVARVRSADRRPGYSAPSGASSPSSDRG